MVMRCYNVEVGMSEIGMSEIGIVEYRFYLDGENNAYYSDTSLERALDHLSPCQIVWMPKVMRNQRRAMEGMI